MFRRYPDIEDITELEAMAPKDADRGVPLECAILWRAEALFWLCICVQQCVRQCVVAVRATTTHSLALRRRDCPGGITWLEWEVAMDPCPLNVLED